MPKAKDWTGVRFGRLVGVRPVERRMYYGRHIMHWLWQCDCGNTIERPSSPVAYGTIKSCGCRQRETRKENIFPGASAGHYRDLAGQKFNRMTAVRIVGFSESNGAALWLFRCDCGIEKVLPGHQVAHGNTKSCGCLHREQAIERLALARCTRNAMLLVKKRKTVGIFQLFRPAARKAQGRVVNLLGDDDA